RGGIVDDAAVEHEGRVPLTIFLVKGKANTASGPLDICQYGYIFFGNGPLVSNARRLHRRGRAAPAGGAGRFGGGRGGAGGGRSGDHPRLAAAAGLQASGGAA